MSGAKTVLIAGCGDVGCRLARQLLARGLTVYGLRRNVSQLPAGVLPVTADLQNAERPAEWPVGQLDYLVYCAAASESTEAGYRTAYVDGLQHVLEWLKRSKQKPLHALFVSSTSVYGQQHGEWVDEQSPAEPQGFTGRVLLEAERLLLVSGLPASVVRLAGIYGPGRSWLLNQVRQGYRVATDPPLYGNRIHADDAAGLLEFLLRAAENGQPLEEIYIGVDDVPAPLHEVVDWLREQLDVRHWAAEARVRRAGSKRCSNARARALGWKPSYTDYRAGYTALLADA